MLMRIAMLAPLRVAVPPTNYGGTERVISNVTEALVKIGHDVTLYASGDSQTRARLAQVIPQALGFVAGQEWQAYHVAMLADFYRNDAHKFDIIHAHMDYFPLPFAAHCSTPTVTTLHGRLDFPEFQTVYRAFPTANYVAISQSQRDSLPDVNWAGVVHHAVDVDDFTYYPDKGKYLAFVGRISPEKRPDRAIEIAKRTGIPLKIAAKVDPADQEYFDTVIKPLLDHPLIEFLGMVDEQGKREIMGNSMAVLMPIDWPEPFGMVFIEALACGVPVLTCPCGSAPELLEDGVTGFIRDSVDGLVEAVGRLDEISRAGCRAYAKRRFDTRRMARDYAKIFAQIIQRKQDDALPILAASDQPKQVLANIAHLAENSKAIPSVLTANVRREREEGIPHS